ncbi:TrkA family potassium uptake protein [candidate division KSB1 bacterium]|nr:TrkA family potassium uptake protein [candidate division KSB1 bacterium]
MRNIAVIGLSSFGFYLCKYLSEAGVQVMAIDNSEDKINSIKSFVKKAIVADAKQKETLKNLSINDFDAVVISVGDKIDTSVLVTLYLRELGVKEIIAKTMTDDHAKILNILGATSIIFPERDTAKRVARTLRGDNMLDYVPLGEDYSIIEIAPPQIWLGRTLIDLDIRREYNVQIIMIKELIPENTLMIPSGEHIIKDSDVLVILGNNKDLERVEKL